MTEIWKPVLGWEGMYSVSDFGRVRSEQRVITRITGKMHTIPGRILKNHIRYNGYHMVSLCVKSKPKGRLVHRLVLMSFIGPAPLGMEACHNNGVSGDNRLSNLRWGTHLDNIKDKFLHGTDHNSTKSHCIRGHEFDELNTKIRSNGSRFCKTCGQLRGKIRDQKIRDLKQVQQ